MLLLQMDFKQHVVIKKHRIVPWRKSNVNYTQNDMYVDVEEKVDVIVSCNGERCALGCRLLCVLKRRICRE